jgi:hypothetical protein
VIENGSERGKLLCKIKQVSRGSPAVLIAKSLTEAGVAFAKIGNILLAERKCSTELAAVHTSGA